MNRSSKRGFSLIELLAVIAIVGILASIIIPVIGRGIKSANKATAASNLRQIALSYASCLSTGKVKLLNSSSKANVWASQLADKAELNDPALYILQDDYLVSQSELEMPVSIGARNASNWEINSDFEKFPLSITIITNLSPQAPATSTPLAYTRGLNPDTGKWDEATGDNGGVYGTNGGFIVFLDGHVEFFEDLGNASKKLVKYGTNQSTTDIRETVNVGAKAINWKGTLWTH